MQLTFVMLKPDALKRKLAGQIISHFECSGFDIVVIDKVLPSRDLVELHYDEHIAKPFYGDLVNFVCSGPVIPMIVSHPNAIAEARKIIGAVGEGDRGTIRGKFFRIDSSLFENLVHSSDSGAAVDREIALWFGKERASGC